VTQVSCFVLHCHSDPELAEGEESPHFSLVVVRPSVAIHVENFWDTTLETVVGCRLLVVSKQQKAKSR
jgi:hypothetical protein